MVRHKSLIVLLMGIVLLSFSSCKKTHNHKLVHHDKVDATCTTSGYEAYDECEECDYTTYKVIEKLDHDPSDWIIAKKATCIAKGVKYKECKLCKTELVKEDIQKAEHDLIHHDKVDATCTKDGIEAFDECRNCEYNNYQTIKAKGHTPSEWLIDKNNNNDYVEKKYKKCLECGEILETKTDEHEFNEKGTCNSCGESIIIFELSKDKKSLKVIGLKNENIKYLVIPNIYEGVPVTSIAEYAFEDNNYIEYIYIPENVESLSSNIFYGCNNLKTIEVAKDNQYYTSIAGVLYDKDCKFLMKYPANKKEDKFVMPVSVENIAFNAFANAQFSEIIMSPILKAINYRAFYNCQNLKMIDIPDVVIIISHNSFEGCNNLSYVKIGVGVKSIEAYSFDKCYNLSSIEVAEGNNQYKSINGDLYSKDGTKLIQYAIGKKESSLIIPDYVKEIGDFAFRMGIKLTDVVIGPNVKRIGTGAFSFCSNLKSITISKSVEVILEQAFYKCDALNIVNIESIESWFLMYFEDQDSNPLQYAHNLYVNKELVEDLVVPTNIDSINPYAFYGCTSIKTVLIHEDVDSIMQFAFTGCTNITDIYIIGDGYWYSLDGPFDEFRFADSKEAKEYLVDKYSYSRWWRM